MQSFVSSTEAARILGIGERSVQQWVKDGIIRPSRRGRGRGRQHLLSILDVLAVALARDLRRRGFNLDQAGRACEWLLNQDLGRLQAQWQGGESLLLIVGAMQFPRLLSSRSLPNELIASHQSSVPVAVVDLQAAYGQIIEQLRNEQHEPVEAR